MASHLLEVLEKAEQVWREQSPEWKRKVSQWEAWQARQKNKERTAQKAGARKRDLDGEAPQHSEDRSWESYFDPQDPSPQFSFASHSAYPKKDLLEDIENQAWTSTKPVFFRALWRGIGVHHSGMNKLYRVLVERCAPFVLADCPKLTVFAMPDFSVLASFESSLRQVRYFLLEDLLVIIRSIT